VQKLSRAQLIRNSPRTVLLSLFLLAACAHQPARPPTATTPVAIPALPATEPEAVASVADPSGVSSPADPALGAAGPTAEPGASGVAADSSTATDSAHLPGPPADSLVTIKQTELFARLRAGFVLDDVDEPAVASQVNWFANHPDFLERTWGRAGLWLYYIVGQLEQRKMPVELALLPVIESGFEPYAYSRARAAGLWQFISDTGRRFGLKQDWWYDGRRDPIEATRAALDYLQALHDEFDGDWLLAIAAWWRIRSATVSSSAASRTSRISSPSPPAARSICRSWPISPGLPSRICTS
jgi:hypothetical protein